MAGDWSAVTGLEGFKHKYSLSEFKEQLEEVDLSSKEVKYGWVFWRPPERFEQLFANSIISPLDLQISSETVIKDKIKRLLEEMIPWDTLMVQFWAPEVDEQQQHVYLTTAHQPFAVGRLYKGYCLYRRRCMRHRHRVDKGAAGGELGAVGRVYRNKRPESSPDLRLYSITEFPLRNVAARCGLRAYLALPVFDDLLKEKCYGVIEVLSFHESEIYYHLEGALKATQLRTTHLNSFSHTDAIRDADGEITKMLELAIRLVPQLQIAQVWVPFHECSSTSNNLSCMQRATFITAGDRKVNACWTVDNDMHNYLEACCLHKLQVGRYRNMIAAVMSSNNKSCICQNICNFSISENPVAHHAQKARLSFCFAICLWSLHNSSDFCVVEFFLHCSITKDAFVGSFLSLLVRIMDMKLVNYMFPYKGQCGDEIVVEVLKENMPSFGESSQSIALQFESIKYKLQHSEELSSLLMVMEWHEDEYLISDFTKYLQKADLHCLEPSRENKRGWTFWSQAREESSENEIDSNSSPRPDAIQVKIKRLMSEITSKWWGKSYALAQFWAPKMDGDRCCLETSDQPFALGRLHKGLAFFRKQCIKHQYFVDEAGKEEELGPPGRVFLNGHPEITPDMRFYSPTEFPLINDIAHCCLRQYFALPVFDLNQHKCVGVLELVEFSAFSLKVIKNALEAANLSSPHINFEPSLQGSHVPPDDNAECWQLALTEIKEASEMFNYIPQLYAAQVWVPYSKCPSINNKVSCMERVFESGYGWKFDWLVRKIKHVETGKGIIGMALTSENKSCLCPNLCGFGTADEPRAHYAQQDRLDICFAICLQSWHTGDLLYVLEFYLNQGPWKYEYLMSFLCLLTSIMKQKLKSFRVASGQQLGERLVVEVIEFSEVDELDLSELDQLDVLPITFKFVNYRSQRHSKGKQVQSATEVMESVRIVAEAEHAITSAANLKKKKAAEETREGKSETQFGQKRKDAAKEFGISLSTLKRRCRENGIKRWPENENHKKNPSLFMRESADESAPDSQQNSSCSNPPLSDTPLRQNAPHADPESSQGLVAQPKDDIVIVSVKYENKKIAFKLRHSAGMEKLENEVATRLKLDVGRFELEYLDEDNERTLLTYDSDLVLCLESLAAVGKIQMFAKSI